MASIRDETSLKRLTITNKQLVHGELERRGFVSTFVIVVFVISECEFYLRSKLSKVLLQENQHSMWRANRVYLTVLKQFTWRHSDLI